MWGVTTVRRRPAAAGVTAVATVAMAGVVVLGGENAYPAGEVRLGSGSAWLASSRVGQIALLDGSSAEVAAQVQVAPAGNALEVVQQGPTAYVVDQTAGTVRRVDGATFESGTPQAPIPDARAGLTAVPGRDVVYTLDTRRGVLANTDPGTLVRRGELLSLATQLSAGTATVDDTGTLWAIDNATGDLVRVAGGSRTIRRQVAQPGRAVLTVVNGHPVVVDPVGRKVIDVDRDTGRSRGTIDLDLRPDDTLEVAGSARAERLYLVAGRGVLNLCDLEDGNCDKAIPLRDGDKFGTPVEAGNRIFVPNYSTGQVWIVDLAQSRVIATPTVLSAPGQFQLLTRDGVVFFNDTDSERAGVIRLDGTVVPVNKFDPDNPAKGLTNPDPTGPPVDQNDPPADQDSPPGDRNEDQPDNRDNDPPGSQDDDPPGNQDTDPPGNQDTDPPGNQDTDPPGNQDDDPPGNPDDPQKPTLDIAASNKNPTVDEPVTLQVNNLTGDQPTGAEWTFGDGEQGSGVLTSHKWTAPSSATGYLVTVVATLPDGQKATTSVNIIVTETPTFTLTVDIPGGGGTVSGGGINCPGLCSIAVPADTQVTLTAEPDGNHELGNWGGACAGTAATCEVTMNADKAVTYTFTSLISQVTISVVEPDGGVVTGGPINCPPDCAGTVDRGSQIQLTATPDEDHLFDGWLGICTGQATTCTARMDEEEVVGVRFSRRLISNLNCSGLDFQVSCNVTVVSGSSIRWSFLGDPAPAFNDKTRAAFPCQSGELIDVLVTVSAAGSDPQSERRDVICQP